MSATGKSDKGSQPGSNDQTSAPTNSESSAQHGGWSDVADSPHWGRSRKHSAQGSTSSSYVASARKDLEAWKDNDAQSDGGLQQQDGEEAEDFHSHSSIGASAGVGGDSGRKSGSVTPTEPQQQQQKKESHKASSGGTAASTAAAAATTLVDRSAEPSRAASDHHSQNGSSSKKERVPSSSRAVEQRSRNGRNESSASEDRQRQPPSSRTLTYDGINDFVPSSAKRSVSGHQQQQQNGRKVVNGHSNGPAVQKRANGGGRSAREPNNEPVNTWSRAAWAEGSGWAGARFAEISRQTKETTIKIILNLDGGELETVPELVGERTNKHAFQSSPSQYIDIDTGIGFLDHMLHALAKHGGWSLYIKTKGDLYIDDHHTTEDTFLALGECFHKAMTWSPDAQLGLNRYGYAYAPLDEALSRAVVDLSARPHATVDLGFKREMIGTLSTEMITHAFQSFAQEARITLHVHCLHGDNDHHRAESAFKALAVASRMALSKRSGVGANEMQSTKGVLY